MKNAYDEAISRTYKPVDTKYLHLLKLDVDQLEINCSASSIFLSLDILIPRIFLLSSPIATQSHINSEPIFIKVSSMMNSSIFFFLSNIFLGLYFCIQFQTDTWFLFINGDKCCDTFLSDRPEK